MKYNTLSYLIGEGFGNVLKNKKSTGASVMIMCATMLIFGLFFVIGENINSMVKDIETQQGMRVFIQNVDSKTEKEIGDKIRAINGVNTATFVSKEDALNEVKATFKNKQALVSGYTVEDSPFPASYIVTLTDLNMSKQVQAEINKLDNIRDITVKDDTIETLVNIANVIRIVSGVILILLIFISVFIIANTIKLTVHARRKEISIMKYVGATNAFIRAPFIVEGVVIGVVSGTISIIVLGLSYNYFGQKIIEKINAANMTVSLLSFADMFTLVIAVYLILGIGIGVIGSIISMKKYLKV